MRGRSYNPAFMHPDDLARLGVEAGDVVEIRSEYDAITGVAEADADLRPGVVSMSHGFGGNPGEDEDPRVDGANTNRLLRTDVEFDRYTGIPRMGALPVAVVPVASSPSDSRPSDRCGSGSRTTARSRASPSRRARRPE